MESSQNIIQFADTARERVRGPPHGHGFASAPSLYRALQRLRLDIQRMKAQAPGPVAEAVQTAALREDANNTRTTQAVIHDEADEYGGRRAEKLSGLTRSGTAPTQSSLYTLPNELAASRDTETHSVTQPRNPTISLTTQQAILVEADEYGGRRAGKLALFKNSRPAGA